MWSKFGSKSKRVSVLGDKSKRPSMLGDRQSGLRSEGRCESELGVARVGHSLFKHRSKLGR